MMCSNVMSQRPCPKGAACNFAHSPMELRQPGGMMPGMGPPGGPGGFISGGAAGGGGGGVGVGVGVGAGGGAPTIGAGGRYKTVMCNNMATTGTCGRGTNCNFAHSQVSIEQKVAGKKG